MYVYIYNVQYIMYLYTNILQEKKKNNIQYLNYFKMKRQMIFAGIVLE